ncbi:MAG: hypothetical protein WCI55_17250, partial [Armatimonadota bacterium]
MVPAAKEQLIRVRWKIKASTSRMAMVVQNSPIPKSCKYPLRKRADSFTITIARTPLFVVCLVTNAYRGTRFQCNISLGHLSKSVQLQNAQASEMDRKFT